MGKPTTVPFPHAPPIQLAVRSQARPPELLLPMTASALSPRPSALAASLSTASSFSLAVCHGIVGSEGPPVNWQHARAAAAAPATFCAVTRRWHPQPLQPLRGPLRTALLKRLVKQQAVGLVRLAHPAAAGVQGKVGAAGATGSSSSKRWAGSKAGVSNSSLARRSHQHVAGDGVRAPLPAGKGRALILARLVQALQRQREVRAHMRRVSASASAARRRPTLHLQFSRVQAKSLTSTICWG